MVLAIFLIVSISMFVRSYFNKLEAAGLFTSPEFTTAFHQDWSKLLVTLSSITLIYCAVVFTTSLFLTRSIIGPVIAFKNRIEKLLETRRLEDFKLREGDELTSLVDIYKKVGNVIGATTDRK